MRIWAADRRHLADRPAALAAALAQRAGVGERAETGFATPAAESVRGLIHQLFDPRVLSSVRSKTPEAKREDKRKK